MIAGIITRRLLSLAAVLFVVSVLIFTLGTLIPGDLTSVLVGQEGATQEQFDEVRKRLGLDQPLIVQYFHWLTAAVQGDLGTSPITGRNVSTDLAQQIPVSADLAILTLIFSTLIGVPIGIIAAVHANKRADVAARAILLTIFSIPVFVIGIVLLLVVSAVAPELFQVSYIPFTDDPVGNLRSMALPVMAITLPFAAMTMQLTRSAMLEVLGNPFIVTARAVGVRSTRIHYLHALRNALPPLVTFLGFQFGVMLGGLIVVEHLFGLPGLGRGLLEAINNRDYPAVTATTMVFAIAFVLINAVIDILYPILDPRQRR